MPAGIHEPPSCNRCGALDDLVPDPNRSFGVRRICVPCNNAQSAEWREKRKKDRVAAGQKVISRGPPSAGPEAVEPAAEFSVPDLPSEVPPIDELRDRRRREWSRKREAHDARRLIPVDVFTEGPIALAVFGDLHIDDPGTNFPLIEKYTQLVIDTPGMFAASVGDLQNAWIGRLARLWSSQSTTGAEAWALVEWWVKALGPKLLFLNNGNHDAWAYNVNGLDPLEWIKGQQTVIGRNGVRMQLRLPSGHFFNINCRHDFRGRSEINPAFGVAKSTRLAGHVDDIALAGHTHESGYSPLKNPTSKRVCHPFRVASFKEIDQYAEESGFPDGNITECPAFVFDTTRDDPRHVVHCDFSLERGAETLTMLREKWARSQQPPSAPKKRKAA